MLFWLSSGVDFNFAVSFETSVGDKLAESFKESGRQQCINLML